MSIEEKINMLEEVMDLDEGILQIDSVLADFEEWDSLSKLSLISEVKQNFGKILSADEIRHFSTVKDICDYLE